MYGVIYLTKIQDFDPEFESLEMFSTFDEAQEKAKNTIEKFIEEYGGETDGFPTKENPVATAYNDDVTGYVYIAETNLPS